MFEIVEVEEVEELESFEDEYVYDICMSKNNKWFFGNGLLVHNSYYIEIKNYLDDQGQIKSLSELEPKSPEWTDVMMKMGDMIMDSVHEKYKELGINMNSIEDKIFLDFEQVYSRMIFTSVKKRYSGDLAWHKGNLLDGYNVKHKGFELIKRDGIPLMKKKQEELLNWMIKQDVDLENIQNWVMNIRKYILGEINDKPKFDELAEAKRVTKSPDEYKNNKLPLHVRMMIKQQKEGDQIGVGQSIRYVATRGESKGEYQSDAVSERQFNKLLEKYGDPPYDKVHYWNRIYKPLASILGSVFPEIPWSVFEVERSAKNIFDQGLSDQSEEYLKAHKEAEDLFSI